MINYYTRLALLVRALLCRAGGHGLSPGQSSYSPSTPRKPTTLYNPSTPWDYVVNCTCSLNTDYHCGGTKGWSSRFYFRARTAGTNWSPKIALYGDLGNQNAQSLPFLQEEGQRGDYDAILHIGKLMEIILVFY